MVLWWRKGAFYDLNEFLIKRGTKLKVFHKNWTKKIRKWIDFDEILKKMSCFEDFIDHMHITTCIWPQMTTCIWLRAVKSEYFSICRHESKFMHQLNANFRRRIEIVFEFCIIYIQYKTANPLLCNKEGVICKNFPVVDLNPENNKELQLRAWK